MLSSQGCTGLMSQLDEHSLMMPPLSTAHFRVGLFAVLTCQTLASPIQMPDINTDSTGAILDQIMPIKGTELRSDMACYVGIQCYLF
jgi:hypothetical protein